jgi:hypothetical protein
MPQETFNNLPDYTISLNEAQARIQLYQQSRGSINTNAFTIRLSELTNLCNRAIQYDLQNPTPEDPINAIRFYLGAELVNKEPVACLICVPVSGFEHDGQTPINGGADVLSLRLGSYKASDECDIYDFSFPCPTTCATNPVLNPPQQ